MSFKIDYLQNGEGLIKELTQQYVLKADQWAELYRKIPDNFDIGYMAESIANARPTLAGRPILDHVTIYYDANVNSQGANATNNKRFESTKDRLIDGIANTATNLYRRSEIEKSINSFKNKGIVSDLSVTFDYLYINVENPQIISRQRVKGRSGTVKTWLGRDDYIVTLTGKTIGGNPLVYDTDTVRKFKDLINMGLPLQVDSVYLNRIWGINQLVFENNGHSQSQELGKGNMIDFNITAYSDDNVDFVKPTLINI